MTRIEFTATVKQGQIEIPKEYHKKLQDFKTVKVTVSDQISSPLTGAIAQLLNHPISVKEFVPLTREEAHERGK